MRRRLLPLLLASLCTLTLAACGDRSPRTAFPWPENTSWHALGPEHHTLGDARGAVGFGEAFDPFPRWFGEGLEAPAIPDRPTLVPTSVDGSRLHIQVQERKRADHDIIIQLDLETGRRTRYRQSEHRNTNFTPFLFAVRTDDEVAGIPFDGAVHIGGITRFHYLADANKSYRWTYRIKPTGFAPLFHGRQPKRVHLIAAFCELQHNTFAAAPDDHVLPTPQELELPFEGAPLLVRSEEITIDLEAP